MSYKYKNVDIKDLESILTKGVLSLNVSGNNNWNEGKRADNSCDIVYLFHPLTEENSFCQYGVALLEVDIPDFELKENTISKNDSNNEKYIEYVTDRVNRNSIKAIYIPKLFRKRIDLPVKIASKITWCDMKANYYENGKERCPDEVLKQFADTAEIMDSSEFNFFRGMTDKRTMIDLYDIQYIW